MFWKKDKTEEGISKAIRDVSVIHANNLGATRRATSMIPVASGSHEIAHTSSVRFHQLLISLEGNQRTGCLRIISPRRKSRSAILIYRGRVVGCLYGCKKLDYQYLQQDAHKHALADLAQPGNILDAYELPEELVLAAASLFNGDTVSIDMQQSSSDMLDQALRTIAEMNLPGCAVVSNIDDEMVCMVYMYAGKIIGVFSARDGWVKPSYETAMDMIKSGKPSKVMASCLPVADLEQAKDIGFSLTGLDAIIFARNAMMAEQMQAVESFASIRTEGQTYSNIEDQIKEPHHRKERLKPRWKKDAISTVPSHNVFAICP